MPEEFETHECEDVDWDFVPEYNHLFSWHLSVGEAIIEIRYCPYCGKKLDLD